MNRSAILRAKITCQSKDLADCKDALASKNEVIEYTKNELAQSERELYAAVDELARLERVNNRVRIGIGVACWVALVEGLAIATLLIVR